MDPSRWMKLCWKGCSTAAFESAGYKHRNKYNFVDPFTGVYTQNVERMWGAAKWGGTKQDFLDSYFIEFMARRKATDDVFMWTFEVIAETFPPGTVLYRRASTTETLYICT